MRLLDIIKRKWLKVNLKKVKAHSGDIFNDKVDTIVKEGSNFPGIIWKDPRWPLWLVLSIWNNLIIDISPRDFIKEIYIKETVVTWS